MLKLYLANKIISSREKENIFFFYQQREGED